MKNKKSIDFPAKLCEAVAEITEDFSFAYLKEAFVATLLDLARAHDGDDEDEDSSSKEEDPLDRYEFWRAFKAQVKILRREMGDDEGRGDDDDPDHVDPRPRTADAGFSGGNYVSPPTEYEAMFGKMRLQGSSQQAALPQHAARQSAPSASGPRDMFAPLAENRSKGVWDL